MAIEEGTGSRTAPSDKKSASKSSAKKSPAANGAPDRQREAPRAAAPRTLSGGQVAAAAARQLLQLTGREAEGVTGLQKTEDGWKVQVEVVEVRRIPDTTDILALYEVDVDSQGELQGYQRLRRYSRGAARED